MIRQIELPENPFLKWIQSRIKRNKNAIIVFNGPTGSGKSYGGLDFSLKIAEKLKTNFNVKENMDFSFSKLLEKMQFPQNKKPGTVFLFEEVGAIGGGGSARQWQSKANSFFHSFMQTSRHKNQIFIMSCPMFSNLEKGARELCHLQLTMQSIDQNKKQSVAKPFLIQSNPVTGKLYMKYLRVIYQGRKIKVTRAKFDLPPKEVIKDYEVLKTKYTDRLNQYIMDESAPDKKQQKGDRPSNEVLLDHRVKGLTRPQIASIYGVSLRTICNWIAQAKNEAK